MRALIVGHFGGNNTGDEAMLSGMLTLAKPSDNVTILTKDKKALSWIDSRHRVLEAGQLRRFGLVSKGFDTFIFCGGTHFHDNYKSARLLRHWAYLMVQVLLAYLAKQGGCKVIVLGNGFGPLRYRLTRKLTAVFCGLADSVTVRDNDSDHLLNKLNIKHKLHYDLAFLNQYKPTEKNKTILGISVTNDPGYARHISDEDYIERMARITKAICYKRDIEQIHVIVIRGGLVESDRAISEKLILKLNEFGFNATLIGYENNPAEMIAAIAECSFFIGARFHSVILSLLTGISHIGIIPYHQKLNSLASDFGLSRHLLDIYNESFELELEQISELEITKNTMQELKNGVAHSRRLIENILHGE